MTKAAVGSRRQVKRSSAIPRLTTKIQKSKTSPISAVVKSTFQGRNHSKKPKSKSVRFVGLREKSSKVSPKAVKESFTGFPANNSHIGDDFVFEADPDALASILNNDGVTRAQLIKSQAAEATKKEQSADEFLLIDGRPSLCRRVPIKRAAGALPDGRPSLLSTRVSMGPARVERPSVSGRTSFLKKSSVAPSFGRDSLYSFIEQKYSQRLQHANLEHGQRPTTIASATCQDLNRASKLKDRTNSPENREPQRVLSTKKVIPTTPAARVLVEANPISGSPALRVRQSDKKTPVKSRLALAGSPEMKENVVTALDFQDDENTSPNNVQPKANKKQIIPTQAKSRSRLQRPLPVPKKQVSGSKPLGSVATKSKLPPRNSDRYSFIRKPAPSKVAKDKLHVKFSPINLKSGEEMVEPKTLNNVKLAACESKSRLKQERCVEVRCPVVLNQPHLKSMGSDQSVSTLRDVNHNIGGRLPVSDASKKKLKSPKGSGVSRLTSKKVIDADTMLEMLKQRMKTIKRRSVQTEFCSVITSMEKEMALASVAEEAHVSDTIDQPDVSSPGHDKAEISPPTTAQAAQIKAAAGTSSLRDVEGTSWHNILKRDKSPTRKAILKKEEQTEKANAPPKLSDDNSSDKMAQIDSKPPTWKDVLKQDAVSPPSNPSAKSSTLMSTASMENLRRLLGSEPKQKHLPGSAFKGGAYNTGAGLGITREKFLKILSYTPSPAVKSDPVSARNKFFQPVLGDETSDSSNSMVSKETKDGRAVFESLKLEDGKFFPDSRLNVRGSRESDMPTAVGSHPKYLSNLKNSSLISTSTTEVEPESNDNGKSAGENSVDVEGLSRTMENMNPPNTAEYSKSACLMEPDRDRVEDKSSSQTEPQRVDSERASPVGGASNSVQWVEKTPGVSRYETNRARIVDPSRSPESPDFDFTKSLFWVEKTPASHTSKVARKDLSSVAKSARQVVGQAEKPRITCTENKTDADSHFNITDESDSTILPTRDLREPCVKSSTIESDEKEVNQCQENNRLSSSHIKPSPATPSELQYEVRERNHSYIDHQPESSSGAEWSEKSQHKISSGRLGKDANARREECGLAHDDILIVRVFSPNATSPHASTTSPSMDNLTISQKLHRKRESFSHDHKAASPNTVPSYKHVSPTARCNSPANRRKVRFSDVVTRIGSDEAAVGSSMPSPSVNARSQSPCDGYLETKQLRDGCETTPEKPAMKNLKDYNPTDLDLSFLDSLHVIAIETKNDSMAKVSTLARPQHSTTHLQEEAPSTASVTRASQTLPPFTTQSVPNVTTGSYRTQMTTPAIQDNLRPVPSTLPVSVSCESSVYSASSDVKVNISLCKSEDIVTMKEKASVTHELSAKSVSFASAMPETPSCPATNLGTKADGNNMQDATGISQGSRTHGHRNNTMPTNFLIETGGVYSFASQENDANADESPTPLYSRILSREDASSPLQMCHTPLISSPFTRGKADHVPFWKAGDSATPKKEVTTPVIQSNLAPIPSTLPVSVHDTEKDDIITNGKSVNHSLIGSNSSHSVVSITYPDLPDSKYDTSQSCRVGVEESNYPKTHPSACGNNAIKYAIPHALKPTPLKPQSLFADVKDSTVNTTSICLKSAVPIAAPKPIFPPAPETPAAFRQLRRKLQESPVPKTFRSRCSPLKLSAFGGVRKTPQKRVRFMSSPCVKSVCSKRFTEALLDEEVALLTCRRFRSPGTPSKKRRSRAAENPLGRVLLNGDDSHFVPISPMDRNKKPSAAAGSAFSVFKQ